MRRSPRWRLRRARKSVACCARSSHSVRRTATTPTPSCCRHRPGSSILENRLEDEESDWDTGKTCSRPGRLPYNVSGALGTVQLAFSCEKPVAQGSWTSAHSIHPLSRAGGAGARSHTMAGMRIWGFVMFVPSRRCTTGFLSTRRPHRSRGGNAGAIGTPPAGRRHIARALLIAAVGQSQTNTSSCRRIVTCELSPVPRTTMCRRPAVVYIAPAFHAIMRARESTGTTSCIASTGRHTKSPNAHTPPIGATGAAPPPADNGWIEWADVQEPVGKLVLAGERELDGAQRTADVYGSGQVSTRFRCPVDSFILHRSSIWNSRRWRQQLGVGVWQCDDRVATARTVTPLIPRSPETPSRGPSHSSAWSNGVCTWTIMPWT